MPKLERKQTTLYTSLVKEELVKFDALCRSRGLSRSELAREAIRFYLQQEDMSSAAERESVVERRIARMEDHLASLLARAALDVSCIYTVLWHRTDKKERKEFFDTCQLQAADRLRRKLKGVEENIKQAIADEIRS